MSINKNRKFRFSFSDIEDNIVYPEVSEISEVKKASNFKIHNPNKPDEPKKSSQLDAQTQAKLSAMAKQAKKNGGNADGKSMEYLSKIPAKQDNMISMQIAGDKIKELNDKMHEEITSTSADAATTDILTETANDNIIYKNYDINDLNKYIEKIPSMSLLEAVSLKNSIVKELNRLESCQTMIKTVDELRDNFDFVEPGKEPSIMDKKNAGMNVNKQILTANYLDEYGYSESVEEFNDLYNVYQPKLQEMLNQLNTYIDSCKDEAASTTYMTNDFLKVINKKLNNLEASDLNYNMTYKKLTNLKNAFENRTDLNFLKNKLENFVHNKTQLKNLNKALNGTFSDIASKLNSNFAERTMASLINMLDRVFDNTEKILYLLYFLNYICATEVKYNNDAWVKVFVLNLSDMHNGIWDNEESGIAYIDNIFMSFNDSLNIILAYVNNRKVKINPQILSQFEKLKRSDINYAEYVPTENKKENNNEELVNETND